MKVGSLFTGIGGFDLGFERAGMMIAWQCEIDAKARSVLAHHWPAVLPDSSRYKQFGNAVAVPVAEWIGRRIMAVLQ